MVRIMLVAEELASFEDLARGLEKKDGIELIHVGSKQEALKEVETSRIDVVVTDAQLIDEAPLHFVTELMKKYPLINCAMVSSLSPEDFHEYSEGLGVFMQLPLTPGEKEAEKMLEILNSIDVLLTPHKGV